MPPQLLTFDIPDFGQPESTHRVACWQWGSPDAARSVLCVHGLTRNGRDFDWLAQALSADYRVLCPDMPGRGQSQWLGNNAGYSYPAYIADISYMLSHLGIVRTSWVGTSMGGIIGMMMANARPGLIDKLVLNDIGCIVSAAGLQRITHYAGTKPVFASRAQAEAALRERCAPFGIREEAQWQQLFAHSFQQNADGSIIFAADPNLLAGIPQASIAQDIDLWPLWEAVTKIPVLLIRGAQSDILLEDTARQMQARHTNLIWKDIPDTGHAPALMEKEQISLIQQWLAQQA